MIHTTTRSQRLALTFTAAAALLSGCANMSDTERRTATGAAIGAVTGAVLSEVTGNKPGTGAVVGAMAGAVIGNVWSRRLEEQQKAMETATQGTGVDVSRTADNQLKLNIPSDISFDTGRSDIKSNLRPILDQFAQGLGGQPNTEIRIIGHTDSTGPDSVNNTAASQMWSGFCSSATWSTMRTAPATSSSSSASTRRRWRSKVGRATWTISGMASAEAVS